MSKSYKNQLIEISRSFNIATWINSHPFIEVYGFWSIHRLSLTKSYDSDVIWIIRNEVYNKLILKLINGL